MLYVQHYIETVHFWLKYNSLAVVRKTTKPIEGGHRGLQDYRHICYYFYVFNVFCVFFQNPKSRDFLRFLPCFVRFLELWRCRQLCCGVCLARRSFQVRVSFGARHCHIAHERPSCVPRNQHQPIWAFSAGEQLRPDGSSDTGTLAEARDLAMTSLSHSSAWCSLTDKTVATKWVNLGTTAALMAQWWHTFVEHLLLLSGFSGTLCPRTCGIRRFLRTVTGSHWKRFYLRSTIVCSAH